MDEGYMALVISILRNVSPDTAFRMLNGEERWYERRHWTAEDVEEIEALRESGMTWRMIGNTYGVTAQVVYKMYCYRKKKIESSH